MSYAESLLTPDERVLRRERQHPIVLILDSWLAIILWVTAIVLIIIQLFLPEDFFGYDLFSSDTWFGTASAVATLAIVLAGVIVVAWRWWWWRTQEFLVTNRRLVLAWGVLNKNSSDSSLEKINDAQLEISVLGRALDYGTLKVMTAAPLQGADYLDRLSHAKSFKKSMMTAKHELQGGGGGDGEDYDRRASASAPAAATPTPASSSRIDVSGGDDPLRADTPDEVAAVLNQLARLHDDGVISEDEYQSKKSELLDRL